MALTIEKLVTGAFGLAHDGGRTCLVKDVLPGERVEVSEIGSKGGACFYEPVSILETSPMRIPPVCPLYGVCGGCDFQIVSRRDSALLKQESIKDNLRRISGLEKLPVFLEPAFTESLAYRSRVRLHVRLSDRTIGFLGRESSSLVPVTHCPLLTKRIDDLLSERRTILEHARRMMFSNKVNRRTGFVELALQDGDDEVSIDGNDVTALGYLVNSGVFFQSNLLLLPDLLSFVKENAAGSVVMDLYSGVGTFSRLFEGEERTVYAVEKEKRCLELSKVNAPSARSFTADVALFSRRVKGGVDTVIVDPPRTGLHPSVVEMLMSWNSPKIIYVSCDSTTFCRDYAVLKKRYAIEKAKVFDFYPGSSHEESCFVLSAVGVT